MFESMLSPSEIECAHSEKVFFQRSRDIRLSRREFLRGGVIGLALPFRTVHSLAQTRNTHVTLLSAPIEIIGDWPHMLPASAAKVVERMRHACLDGVRLVSDRQPESMRVEEHSSGLPSVWLHSGGGLDNAAWINVDVGERAWSQLAYQFGHELGHVTANSWQRDARPAPPCQWLEEAMVEAFSIRGLGRLADSWKHDPPFPNNNVYGDAIAGYHQNIIDTYSRLAREQGSSSDFGAWFRAYRNEIEAGALSRFAQGASLTILAEYERTPNCVEALGALNRWPGRTGVPIEDYLRLWEASCSQLSASISLPGRLKVLLNVS